MRRNSINDIESSNPTLKRCLYYQMIVLGCADALLILPLSIFLFMIELHPLPKVFWPGWSMVHVNQSLVPVVLAGKWSASVWAIMTVKWDLWISAVTSFGFFSLFGLTTHARSVYWRMICRAMHPLGFIETKGQDCSDFVQADGSEDSIRSSEYVINSELVSEDHINGITMFSFDTVQHTLRTHSIAITICMDNNIENSINQDHACKS